MKKLNGLFLGILFFAGSSFASAGEKAPVEHGISPAKSISKLPEVQANVDPEKKDELVEKPGFLPALSAHANWVFSGVVTSESGENYDYLFQLQRDDHEFHAIVALFDAQTKQVIFRDESRATLEDSSTYNWHVGHAFLCFNPINASWIFGFQDAEKKGFNFKVDMLKQAQHDPVVQDLRHGLEFVVSQTGQLNGHIHMRIGEQHKEQFVTAKTAWFRQIWLTEHQDKNHQLSGVLCQFNDGSGFYSMNMLESDALRGAVAGWYDEQGVSAAMSQFINVKQDADGPWHIRITSPNLHFVLTDSIQQKDIIAGFVSEKDKQGFCMLSQDAMGEQNDNEKIA